MGQSRRQLHFDSFDQAMDEARMLARSEVTTSGNYSLGQIFEHLARVLDVVNGVGGPLPISWIGKLLGRFMRNRAIHQPAPAGFKLPQRAQAFLWPTEDVSVDEGLKHLEKSAAAFLSIQQFPPHPLFGQLDCQENHQLQCRHFELHLSFVHPNQQGQTSPDGSVAQS
jgi:hypothetical protein